MSVTEAAFQMRVRYQTALNRVLTRQIDGVKLVGRWMIDPASVTRYMERRARELREAGQAPKARRASA